MEADREIYDDIVQMIIDDEFPLRRRLSFVDELVYFDDESDTCIRDKEDMIDFLREMENGWHPDVDVMLKFNHFAIAALIIQVKMLTARVLRIAALPSPPAK